MARRFIVVTNSAYTTKEHRDAITRHLEQRQWSVWHWFEDLWLVSAEKQVDLEPLREEIRRVSSDAIHVMVLTTEGPISYAGNVHPNAIPWLRENWQRKSYIPPGAPPPPT